MYQKILHFAPESCFSWKLEQLFGSNYITADLDAAKAKLTLDITNIDLASDSFDKIICFHVLEHVPDDKKAMSELYRVLKPDGTIYVMVPIKGNKTDEDLSITDIQERRKRFGQSDHVRFYGMDIKERLEQAGFLVSVITPKEFIPDSQLRTLFGLNAPTSYDDDFLFVLTKNKL
jgi:SAM-dependent methyltransferase